MKRLALVLAAAVIGAGCNPALGWRWAARPMLKAPPASRFAEHPAVFLLREQRILLVSRWRSPSYTQVQRHDVLAVLTEKGMDRANVRVLYDAKGEVLNFSARTIAADGTVQDVEPSRVFDDVARKNEEDDDLDLKVRVFTLPNVQPGSVIEYQHTIQIPGTNSWFWQYITSWIPVNKYKLVIEGTPDIRYAVKAYNIDAPWQVDKSGDNWRLSFETTDVRAAKSESDQPNRRVRDPWWCFRVSQYVKYNVVAERYRNWNTAMKYRADALYFDNDEYYEDFEPAVDFGDCKNAKCKIEKSIQYLTKELPFRGWRGWSGRKAKKVLRAGEASGVEKTRLLWRILDGAGVKSSFAFTNRFLNRPTDHEFPLSVTLKHLLLWVPEQEGIDQAHWIDPACEFCGLGELPFWLNEAKGLVLDAKKGLGDRWPKVEAKLRPVTGKLRTDETYRRTYDMQVDPDGDVKFELTLAESGRAAQESRNDKREWTSKKWDEQSEEIVKDRVVTATRTGFTKLEVDDRIQSTRRTVRFSAPAYATLDGEEILVPLSHMTSRWDDAFRDDDERKNDIALPFPYTTEEVSIVAPPPGYGPLRLPELVHVDDACFTVTVTAEWEGDRARVTRRVRAKPGVYPRSRVAAVRETLESFSAVRQQFVAFRRR